MDFRINLHLLNCDLPSSEIGTCRRRDFTIFAKIFKHNQMLILKSPSNENTIGELTWSTAFCEPCFLCCPTLLGSENKAQEFKIQNSIVSNINQSLFLKQRRHPLPFPGPQTYNEMVATISFMVIEIN